MKKHFSALTGILFMTSNALASGPAASQWILSDINQLEEAKIKPLFQDENTGLAVAKISSLQQSILSKKSHERGRCGGFEALPDKELSLKDFQKFVSQIQSRKALDEKGAKKIRRFTARQTVSDAIAEVSADKIKEWVTFLSAYNTRYHKGPTPNAHVEALQAKLDEMLKNYPALGASTSLIGHDSTKQKTVSLHIPGKSKPDEIVVMGAHLDSININFIGMPTNGRAPGSDDDASGSASILESLDHLLAMAPFERSIDIFWYAGEEGGLLGSAEVAKSYKANNKNVVGVLQLDMTLYPGSGDGNIASMTDFTSPEMRQLVSDINSTYLGIKILDDKCGYGCSDHASWYRQGYPTVIPTEATFREMNHKIHSADDVIDSGSSFDHAAIFSKIAIAFASHLASP